MLVSRRRPRGPAAPVFGPDPGTLLDLAQAFVAAALGGIGDKDMLPWNTPLAEDINYRARVDTLTNGRTGVLDIL